jgi:hypothetical protein
MRTQDDEDERSIDSFASQRLHIQNQINRYFCGRISVAPRALAALQGAWREDSGFGYGILAVSIFEALLSVSPIALTTLFQAGLPVEKLFSVFQHGETGPAPLVENTLDYIFRGVPSDHLAAKAVYPRRCKAATNIWKTRVLTEADLLQAFFQTAYRGPEVFNEKVEVTRFTTDVGHRLIDAGLIDSDAAIETWDGEAGTYRARSIAAEQFRRITKQLRSIPGIDASHDLFQFALWQDAKGKLRVRPFGVGILSRDTPEYLHEGQTLVFREGILQPVNTVSPDLTEETLLEFEDMINSRACDESQFQNFFTQYPEFLAGIDYKQVHPQLVLFSEDTRNMVPDFILEPLDSRFCDLLELKRPYEELVTHLRNGSRRHFRAVVSEALAQLEEYKRYFDSPRNRQAFHQRYGLQAYNPKTILVIGRRHHFKGDIHRQELKTLLPKDMELLTYDDVLQRARRYHSCLIGRR